MKKLIILCLCLIIATASNSYATTMGVELLSAEHHVWGNVHGKVIASGTEFYYSYDLTGSEAVSGEVTYVPGFIARSSAGPYYLNTFATSYDIVALDIDGNDAFAEATWFFSPDRNNVRLEISGGGDGGFNYGDVWLDDVTASTEVYHFRYDGGDWTEELYDYDLERSHVYSLRMYAESESWFDGQVFRLVANYSVPEPATMLLFGSGLIGLAGFRQRFKR